MQVSTFASLHTCSDLVRGEERRGVVKLLAEPCVERTNLTETRVQGEIRKSLHGSELGIWLQGSQVSNHSRTLEQRITCHLCLAMFGHVSRGSNRKSDLVPKRLGDEKSGPVCLKLHLAQGEPRPLQGVSCAVRLLTHGGRAAKEVHKVTTILPHSCVSSIPSGPTDLHKVASQPAGVGQPPGGASRIPRPDLP